MSEMTKYKKEISEEIQNQILKIAEQEAPEQLLELLADFYEHKEGLNYRIAYLYSAAGCFEICIRQPGHEFVGKQFTDTNETIGERSARLMEKNPKRSIAEVVDFVISQAAIARLVQSAEKRGKK
jgi:hypothetical protein